MERTSNKGDFRANISQHGSGRKITLTEKEIQICVDAAKACDLEFAGVDILKDENDKLFVCEVNGNPGTKIIDLTGHNYFVDLVKFVASKVDNSQKEKGAEAENQAIEKRLEGIAEKRRMHLYISNDDKAFLNKINRT